MREHLARKPILLLLVTLLAAAAGCAPGSTANGHDASAAPVDAGRDGSSVDGAAADRVGADSAVGSDSGELADGGNPDGSPPDAVSPDVAQPDTSVGVDAGLCTLTASGPLVVTAHGQVIENLRVTSTGGPAIRVEGFADVVIRHCEIHHQGGPGILFADADRLRVEDVVITHTGAPATGPNASTERNNLDGFGSADLVVDHARLERGSSGIYLDQCPRAALRFIEGHDFRGPEPRGQLVQFNHSDQGLLEDFSSECPVDTSWTEDTVSAFESNDVVVRRGLVDGNNSPSGVGIMFEQPGAGSGGLVEDVDAVHMGNGCFSAYPGFDVVFRRTRSRDNVCTGQGGREPPESDGLAWAGSQDSSGLRIEASQYVHLCGGLVWDEPVFDVIELTPQNFAPRAPLRIRFCWE